MRARRYVLTREDGREQEWRGWEMADFHLIPAKYEHINRARCNELDSMLTRAGLSWESNGRQDTPRRLEYTAAAPGGRPWSIRPVLPLDFDPWQPSDLWRATCGTPQKQHPALSAHAVAEHIRDFRA
ncbi:hypothetical protein [Streptomyces parvulus]